jgi:hypothetical protein
MGAAKVYLLLSVPLLHPLDELHVVSKPSKLC